MHAPWAHRPSLTTTTTEDTITEATEEATQDAKATEGATQDAKAAEETRAAVTEDLTTEAEDPREMVTETEAEEEIARDKTRQILRPRILSGHALRVQGLRNLRLTNFLKFSAI